MPDAAMPDIEALIGDGVSPPYGGGMSMVRPGVTRSLAQRRLATARSVERTKVREGRSVLNFHAVSVVSSC